MSSTKEKLEYLYDTKKMLQNEINNAGVNVTNLTSFRAYSDKIKQINSDFNIKDICGIPHYDLIIDKGILGIYGFIEEIDEEEEYL